MADLKTISDHLLSMQISSNTVIDENRANYWKVSSSNTTEVLLNKKVKSR